MMVEGGVIVVAGVAVGLTAAMSGTTFLRSLLYEISPHDPTTLTAAAAVAAAIGLLSAYLPVRRASHVEPLVALREE